MMSVNVNVSVSSDDSEVAVNRHVSQDLYIIKHSPLNHINSGVL